MTRKQTVVKTVTLTGLAMIAFTANSLLCRMALGGSLIDAASFTTLRLVAGALTLWLIVAAVHHAKVPRQGDWIAAAMLFLYAIGFSLGYVSLSVGTGALILVGAVQFTMLAIGLREGERFALLSWAGFALAAAGLVYLVSPGLTAPAPVGASMMVISGIAWGIYTLRGRGVADPLLATSGNFLRTVPITIVASLLFLSNMHAQWLGIALAIVSGAIASGVGYVIWYAALRGLTAARAAAVQLAVPVMIAFGGALFLSEPVTLRLLIASAAILGGLGLVLLQRSARAVPPAAHAD